ncbi:MAG: hypothetical protein AAGM67_10710 [Bacteroidota bacterium]
MVQLKPFGATMPVGIGSSSVGIEVGIEVGDAERNKTNQWEDGGEEKRGDRMEKEQGKFE